jgi:hypothetical protein
MINVRKFQKSLHVILAEDFSVCVDADGAL